MTVPADAAESLCKSTDFSKDRSDQRINTVSSSQVTLASTNNTDIAGAEATALTNDQHDNATDMPSRASFLGLPAELRLRIYDYLLDASRRPAVELDGRLEGTPWHCCFEHFFERSIKCGCAKTVHPSILGVSKLVHQEATPVLYSSLEVRLKIEGPSRCMKTLDHDELQGLFQTHYGQARGHASLTTSLLLATSSESVPICTNRQETGLYGGQMKFLWSELGLKFYNVKTIRLYFNLDAHDIDIDENFDYDELLGMLALPKLQKLILELFAPHAYIADHADMPSFMCMLKQKAEEKIKGSGKKVEIVAITRVKLEPESDED